MVKELFDPGDAHPRAVQVADHMHGGLLVRIPLFHGEDIRPLRSKGILYPQGERFSRSQGRVYVRHLLLG